MTTRCWLCNTHNDALSSGMGYCTTAGHDVSLDTRSMHGCVPSDLQLRLKLLLQSSPLSQSSSEGYAMASNVKGGNSRHGFDIWSRPFCSAHTQIHHETHNSLNPLKHIPDSEQFTRIIVLTCLSERVLWKCILN